MFMSMQISTAASLALVIIAIVHLSLFSNSRLVEGVSVGKLDEEFAVTIAHVSNIFDLTQNGDKNPERCTRLVHYLAFHYKTRIEYDSDNLKIPIYLLRRALGDIVRLPVINFEAVISIKSCLSNIIIFEFPIFISGLTPIKEHQFNPDTAINPWSANNMRVRAYGLRMFKSRKHCHKQKESEKIALANVKKFESLERRADARALLAMPNSDGFEHFRYINGAAMVERNTNLVISTYAVEFRQLYTSMKQYSWYRRVFADALIDLASAVYAFIAVSEYDKSDKPGPTKKPKASKNPTSHRVRVVRPRRAQKDMSIEEMRMDKYSRIILQDAKSNFANRPTESSNRRSASINLSDSTDQFPPSLVSMIPNIESKYARIIDYSVSIYDSIEPKIPENRVEDWNYKQELVDSSSNTGIDLADVVYAQVLYDIVSYIAFKNDELEKKKSNYAAEKQAISKPREKKAGTKGRLQPVSPPQQLDSPQQQLDSPQQQSSSSQQQPTSPHQQPNSPQLQTVTAQQQPVSPKQQQPVSTQRPKRNLSRVQHFPFAIFDEEQSETSHDQPNEQQNVPQPEQQQVMSQQPQHSLTQEQHVAPVDPESYLPIMPIYEQTDQQLHDFSLLGHHDHLPFDNQHYPFMIHDQHIPLISDNNQPGSQQQDLSFVGHQEEHRQIPIDEQHPLSLTNPQQDISTIPMQEQHHQPNISQEHDLFQGQHFPHFLDQQISNEQLDQLEQQQLLYQQQLEQQQDELFPGVYQAPELDYYSEDFHNQLYDQQFMDHYLEQQQQLIQQQQQLQQQLEQQEQPQSPTQSPQQ